ncbi:hypothetical protein [Streptomyces sp. NPDC057002]|uniref:hypothetical protein n=1 Tax=Streptomyces sp. NPDC057002 TaxID=3345992 RepID=UPI0036409DFF
MSTAVTSPSPIADFRSAIRLTGTSVDGSLAPAPPTTPDRDFAADAGTGRSTAISEFQHGVTAGR